MAARRLSGRRVAMTVAAGSAILLAGCQAPEDRGQLQASDAPSMADLDAPAQEACRLYRSLGLVGTGSQNQDELARRVDGIAAAADRSREEGLRTATRRLVNAVDAEDEAAFAQAAEQVTLTCVGEEMEQ